MTNRRFDPAASAQIDHIENVLRGLDKNSQGSAAYAAKLSEIKHQFSAFMRFYHADAETKQTSTQIKHMILMGVGLVLYILAFLLMGENAGLRIAVAIAICVLAGVTKKNAMWGVLPAAALIGGMLVDKVIVVIPVFILVYVASELKSFLKKTSMLKQFENDLDRLLALQNEMTALLPTLKAETAAWQKAWLMQNSGQYDENCLLDLEDPSVFPTLFWWQISPDMLIDMENQAFCHRTGDWETRAVNRTSESAFDACDEYSPLFDQDMSRVITSGARREELVIYDIISRTVRLSADAKQYEVPAHDSMSVFTRYTSLIYACGQVDKMREQGKISEDEMRENRAAAFAMLYNAMAYADETKIETEYVPIHEHENIWTGQVLLRAIEEDEVSGYSLVQYCCQPPHLTENLKAIADLPIIFLNYALSESNPIFLAAFYATFPNCI
ncbi:MAG: hypothetical protein IJ048_11040 [Clostridia bacterium]|nr:hypothetical protein [Clostridia bacterium]